MTRLLALTQTTADVEAAVAGGADGIVVRAPADGGSDAPEQFQQLAVIGAAVAGRCPVSLWWVGPPTGAAAAASACAAVALWTPAAPAAQLGDAWPSDLPRWAVVPLGDTDALAEASAAGCVGAILEAGPLRRLLQGGAVGDLEAQVRRARDLGLAVGLSGAMEAPDVPRLLALAPDVLVCGDLLRRDGAGGAAMMPERVRLVQDLVTAQRSGGRPDVAPIGSDRIFLRDWIVPLRVGAYGHERAAQRVRFTIEARVTHKAARVVDMRDVVTYDLIVDAIARATVGHVALVETIAEDVAELILAHPRVASVDVAVEKLDVGPGSLGCRIKRRRAG